MSKITTADLCKPLPLSDEAKPLLAPDFAPRAFIDLLIAKKHPRDAAFVMAAAIPKREAIWWGLLCAKGGQPEMPAPQKEILASIESWLAKPTDEGRRATFALGEQHGYDTPAGFLSMAVFFATGSVSLPDCPVVPPKEHLTAVMVGNVVNLAAIQQGPAKANELYPEFFAIGFDIAAGKNRWKE